MLINPLDFIPDEINPTDCQANFIYIHFNIIFAFTAFSTDIFHPVILKKGCMHFWYHPRVQKHKPAFMLYFWILWLLIFDEL